MARNMLRERVKRCVYRELMNTEGLFFMRLCKLRLEQKSILSSFVAGSVVAPSASFFGDAFGYVDRTLSRGVSW